MFKGLNYRSEVASFLHVYFDCRLVDEYKPMLKNVCRRAMQRDLPPSEAAAEFIEALCLGMPKPLSIDDAAMVMSKARICMALARNGLLAPVNLHRGMRLFFFSRGLDDGQREETNGLIECVANDAISKSFREKRIDTERAINDVASVLVRRGILSNVEGLRAGTWSAAFG